MFDTIIKKINPIFISHVESLPTSNPSCLVPRFKTAGFALMREGPSAALRHTDGLAGMVDRRRPVCQRAPDGPLAGD